MRERYCLVTYGFAARNMGVKGLTRPVLGEKLNYSWNWKTGIFQGNMTVLGHCRKKKAGHLTKIVFASVKNWEDFQNFWE